VTCPHPCPRSHVGFKSRTLVLSPAGYHSHRLLQAMAEQQPPSVAMQEGAGTESSSLPADMKESPTEAENSPTLCAGSSPGHCGGNPPSLPAPDVDSATGDADTYHGEDSWVCWTCGAQGHPSWKCPVRPTVPACSHCHRQGHNIAQCLTPLTWEYHACFECGELGHMARHCPLRSLVWGTWRMCSIHHIPRGVCNMCLGDDGRPRCKDDAPCAP
jgi:hypothetical protein